MDLIIYPDPIKTELYPKIDFERKEQSLGFYYGKEKKKLNYKGLIGYNYFALSTVCLDIKLHILLNCIYNASRLISFLLFFFNLHTVNNKQRMNGTEALLSNYLPPRYQQITSFSFILLSTEETLCVLVTIDSKSRVDRSLVLDRVSDRFKRENQRK